MAFTLPDLPYAHDALAALGMSKETLEFHHDLHHKAYVDNGNKLIAGTEWETKSLEDVVKGTYAAGAVAQNGLFNNASQHWNHNLFWEVMGPGEGKAMHRADFGRNGQSLVAFGLVSPAGHDDQSSAPAKGSAHVPDRRSRRRPWSRPCADRDRYRAPCPRLDGHL